jgi:hypothetical protein
MKKFSKPFYGVRDGDIYPTEFTAGDECPPELEAGAIELGALADETDETDETAVKEALQAQLDAAGIKFDKRWGVDKLRAALAEGKKD